MDRLSPQLVSIKSERGELLKVGGEREASLASLRQQFASLGTELQKCEKELKRARDDQERLRVKSKRDVEELEELKKDNGGTKETNVLFKTSNSKLKAELGRLSAEKISWEEERARLGKEGEGGEEERDKLKGELRHMKKDEGKRKKEVDQMREMVKDRERERDSLSLSLSELEKAEELGVSERGELKRGVAELEGTRRRLGESERRKEALEEALERVKGSEAECRKELHGLKMASEEALAKIAGLSGEQAEATRETARLAAALEREKKAGEDGRKKGEAREELSEKREKERDECKEELRVLEAKFLVQVKEGKRTTAHLKRAEEAAAEKEGLERSAEAAREELKGLRSKVGAKDKEVSRLEADVGRLERELGECESDRETGEGVIRAEARKWKEGFEGEKRNLKLKEGELRVAAISAQNSEVQASSLTDALTATSLDFGLRMKDLEEEVNELRGRLGEKERECITVKVRCEGGEGKVKELEDEAQRREEELEGKRKDKDRLREEAVVLKKELKGVEEKLEKERMLRSACEKREMSVKGDCEVLGVEMVEMNGRIETLEKEATGLRKDAKAEKALKSDKEVECRKLREWCGARDGRAEKEAKELRAAVENLEAEKRMVEGEKKGLKMELRRSMIGGEGGGGGGSRSTYKTRGESNRDWIGEASTRSSYYSQGADSGGGCVARGSDAGFSPLRTAHLAEGNDRERDGEGGGEGGGRGFDSSFEDDDLVSTPRGSSTYATSQRDRAGKEIDVARSLRKELDRGSRF